MALSREVSPQGVARSTNRQEVSRPGASGLSSIERVGVWVLLYPSWRDGSPAGSWFRGIGAEFSHCGAGYYFTGDGAYRTEGGYYQITGRMDDVINISGHRLGTAEIEDSMVRMAQPPWVGCLFEASDLLAC